MPKNIEIIKEDEKNESPISELEEILDEAGEDIRNLFGAALTIFAGADASSKDSKQKEVELERMIFRN